MREEDQKIKISLYEGGQVETLHIYQTWFGVEPLANTLKAIRCETKRHHHLLLKDGVFICKNCLSVTLFSNHKQSDDYYLETLKLINEALKKPKGR